MLRQVQAIGWSLLSPQPLALQGPVVCLLGRNGSGKSSMLDAVKAVLGARKFGSQRTPASYRFAGRAGWPAARKAMVLLTIDNRRTDGGSYLESRPELLTMVMDVSAKSRRFCLLDGEHLIDAAGDLDEQCGKLRLEIPAAQWLKPEQWNSRVLDPLGFGPAVRRLLELPQGELSRALDRDERQMTGLLIELTGGQDAQKKFISAEAALDEARERHRESRRAADRARVRLAEMRLDAKQAADAQLLRERVARLGGRARQLLDEAPKPGQRTSSLINWRALQRAGIKLLLEDGVICVDAESLEEAKLLLGPGESLPLTGASGVLTGEPATQLPTSSPVSETRVRELTELLNEIEAAQLDLEAPGSEEEQLNSAELAGYAKALRAGGLPGPQDQQQAARLAEIEAEVAGAEAQLTKRDQLLEEAGGHLTVARAAYESATRRALEGAASRFAGICSDAGLAGEMTVTDGAHGPLVRLAAAESVGEPLRELHGSGASLSGGWRTTVLVLAVLACLDENDGLPCLLLDEVGSSLDESRLLALGEAFRALGERRGLQTIMSMPSQAMSDTVAQFAAQQVGFIRPLADEPLAPAPHVVSASPLRLAA